MQFAQLGQSGIFVSRLCLGTMTFGGDSAIAKVLGGLSQPQVDEIVGQAIEAGINFVDSADVYSAGESEIRLGEALRGRRNEVVLATKCGGTVGSLPNHSGLTRLHMMRALEDSLRRLKTDHIDLYQLHNFDPWTPLDETLRALDDMLRQGKVRAIGCSNFMAWQLVKALGISERKGLGKFASIQSFYSLAGRDIERELVPALNDSGVGLICWSPLAGGLLSGKFSRDGASDPAARRSTINFPPVDLEKTYDVINALQIVATRHDATCSQIALAWLLAQKHVTSVITGVKRADQLADNLKSLEISLSEDDLAELDAASKVLPTYPGWIQTYGAATKVPKGFPFTGKSWSIGQDPV